MFNQVNEDIKFFIQDKIRENITKIKMGRTSWNFRCPICGDSHKNRRMKRGWYYIATDSYHCFNAGCPANGSVSGVELVAFITSSTPAAVKSEFFKSLRKNPHLVDQYKRAQEKLFVQMEEEAKRKKEMSEIPAELQDSWVPLPEDIAKIVKDRKIMSAPNLPKNGFELFFDTEDNRIVIPWRRAGELVFWQGRAVRDGQQPKYKGAVDRDKDVFNYDNIDEDFQYVFCLEGALDAVWVKNGVAVGGVTLTDKQVDLLSKKLCTPVIMLDNNWVDSAAREELEKICKNHIKQKVFIWPRGIVEKDVNEYVINQKDNLFFSDSKFLESRVFNGARALMEMKLTK